MPSLALVRSRLNRLPPPAHSALPSFLLGQSQQRRGGGGVRVPVAAQLSFAAESWTVPQDQVRASAGDDATRRRPRRSWRTRLHAAGETRIPLYVLDAGYDEAPPTWDLREHLDRVRTGTRHRVPGKAGRPGIHGPGTGRSECKDPAAWGAPDQELPPHDCKYGQVSVKSWSGLHPKLFCRGRFARFAKPPGMPTSDVRLPTTPSRLSLSFNLNSTHNILFTDNSLICMNAV